MRLQSGKLVVVVDWESGSSTTGYACTTYRQNNTGKKKTPSTTFYTATPFQYNYTNHTSPNHKNSNRPLTQKCRNGPRSHTLEKKPHVTNLFRRTNIKIVFRMNNTIYNQLTHKHHNTDIYTQSRVYKLTCPNCKEVYVGQNSRIFLVRYNKYKQAFRNNSHTSKFAQHLVEQAHTFSTIHNTMQVLHYQKKNAYLNVVERYCIPAEFMANNHLNNNQNTFPNPTFDAIIKTHQQ